MKVHLEYKKEKRSAGIRFNDKISEIALIILTMQKTSLTVYLVGLFFIVH